MSALFYMMLATMASAGLLLLAMAIWVECKRHSRLFSRRKRNGIYWTPDIRSRIPTAKLPIKTPLRQSHWSKSAQDLALELRQLATMQEASLDSIDASKLNRRDILSKARTLRIQADLIEQGVPVEVAMRKASSSAL